MCMCARAHVGHSLHCYGYSNAVFGALAHIVCECQAPRPLGKPFPSMFSSRGAVRHGGAIYVCFLCIQPNRENEGSKNLIFAIQKRKNELVAPDFLACGEIFSNSSNMKSERIGDVFAPMTAFP